MMKKEESIKVIVEATPRKATDAVAELFRKIVSDSIESKGLCRVALSGGTTPRALYERLARDVINDSTQWDKIEIFFGDERDVPQDHLDSNYRMVQRALLDHVPIPPGKVHPMCGDTADLSHAAESYEETIRENVPADKDGVPAFDLILLGMGADGHTASLFPGCPTVVEKNKLVSTCLVPALGRSRMTLTFPLINSAKNIILLVTGQDKSDAVGHLLSKSADSTNLPAANITPKNGKLFIVLDEQAAKNNPNEPIAKRLNLAK